MGIFSRKKKEVESIETTLIKKLAVIDEQVVSFAGDVSKSKDQTVQVIHLTGVINKQDGEEKGQCCAVIGSAEGLIEMLYNAGRKEGNFARILFSAAEALSNSTEKMAKLRDEVVLEVNGTCDCPACQAKAKGELNLGGKSIKLNDLENMTPEQMDELVRGIMKDSNFGGPKQG